MQPAVFVSPSIICYDEHVVKHFYLAALVVRRGFSFMAAGFVHVMQPAALFSARFGGDHAAPRFRRLQP
jgi:hypothetical protein